MLPFKGGPQRCKPQVAKIGIEIGRGPTRVSCQQIILFKSRIFHNVSDQFCHNIYSSSAYLKVLSRLMLFILGNFLHGVNAIPEKCFSVLFFSGARENISQAHVSEKTVQLFFEVSQVHQNQSQLGSLLMCQSRIN